MTRGGHDYWHADGTFNLEFRHARVRRVRLSLVSGCEPDSIFRGGVLDWTTLAIVALVAALGAVVGRRRYGLDSYPRMSWWFRRVRDAFVILAALLFVFGVVLQLTHFVCG